MWGHVMLLVTKPKNRFKLDFYAWEAVRQGWSRDTLERHIIQDLHLSRDAADTNVEATVRRARKPSGRSPRTPTG